MINEPQEASWAYLLSPVFQSLNSAGKPITDGWIEVYYHGTRNKYYCSSDFDGTLHPFKIPLDSLGSNVVLADPAYFYDVYIYNKFGTLMMSRYNVSPTGAGSSSSQASGKADHWMGTDGSSMQIIGGVTGDPLPIPVNPEYQGSFIDRQNNNVIYLKEGLYLVDAIINYKQDANDKRNFFGEVLIDTGFEETRETESFLLDETGKDTSDDRHNLRVQFIRNVTGDTDNKLWFKIGSPVNWNMCYIQKLSIVKLGIGGGSGSRYVEGQYISIENDVISVTGINPDEYLTSADLEGYATEQYVDEAISGVNERIDEVSGAIPSLDGYATEQYVDEAIQSATSSFLTSGDLEGYATENWTSEQIEAATSGLQPSGEYLTPADLNGYATESYVDAAVSGKADKSDIPSLDGYATESWVQDQTSAFITSADLPDLSDYVKTSALDEYATKTDLDEYAKTSALDEYAKASALDDYAHTSALDAYATKTDLESYVETSALDEYATKQYVEDATSAFITSGDIPPIPEDVVTSGELATVSGEIVNQIPSLAGYATETYVQDFVGQHSGAQYSAGDNISIQNDTISVSGVGTLVAGENIEITASGSDLIISTSGTNQGLFLATYGVSTYNEVKAAVDANKIVYCSVSGRMAFLAYIGSNNYEFQYYRSNIPLNATDSVFVYKIESNNSWTTAERSVKGTQSDWNVSATGSPAYIKNKPDLSIYATQSYVDAEVSGKADKSEIPSLDGYATESYVTDAIDSAVSGKADKSEIPSLAGYATESYVDGAVSGKADSSALNSYALKTDLDSYAYASALDSYATKTDLDSYAQTSALDAYATKTDLDSYAYASALDSYATVSSLDDYAKASALDEYVNYSEIEYNGQGEVSAISGAPIMTVESEKQWLTHDDTICHVTNSAQYAFGVNVPVVAQSMGTDETELWSSSALASSAALSEPLTNFNFLEVYTRSSDNGYQAFKYTAVEGPVNLTLLRGNNYPWFIMSQLTFSGSTVSVSRTLGLSYAWGSTNIPSAARANNTDDMKILIKVVGIGRKEEA